MNHAHTDRTAYLVGGGIATLAAAVYLVRDGHFQGRNIAILGEAPRSAAAWMPVDPRSRVTRRAARSALASVWPAQGCSETPARRIYLHAPSWCQQASDARGSLGRVRHHCRNTRKALAH